ncbi:RNA-binding protein 41 isoform X1 [Gadus morhua]|uniref:RNA-binding protein 41 isoform X1 n=1 Tax=Gadus morhua TaxID=8049 RepID=UPI0011B66EC0|nr:RNA-binding protein 41 isoform X1 [Gadus morhua]
MRRVSRQACEDGPLLDSQETEGQRQLHSLLVQQLHTDVDIDRLVAKRRCFAPAALYRPFGEQASGVRSLSQFQALQHGDQELASLRELGLTDPEIHLWLSRDAPELTEKSHGVCAAPSARQQRLQVIRDKMAARSELLSRPQRFTNSRALSRREMEIEQALFHGNDRMGFLSALYHRNQESEESQQGAQSTSDPMDSVYRDVFIEEGRPVSPTGRQENSPYLTPADQSQRSLTKTDQSQSSELSRPTRGPSAPSEPGRNTASRGPTRTHHKPPSVPPTELDISRPIGSLCAAGPGGVLTVRGDIEVISEEDIRGNREAEEGIRSIPRFQSYRPGEPSELVSPTLVSPTMGSHAGLSHAGVSPGAVCEEPQCAGVCGPAGGAVLPVRGGGRASAALPPADGSHEGTGLHHAARHRNVPESFGVDPRLQVARQAPGD